MQLTPIFGVFLTVLSYGVGMYCYRATGLNAWANPVLIGVSCILLALTGLNVSFDTYWHGGQILNFLMGPIVVAMAVPLFDNMANIKRQAVPIFVSLLLGGATTLISAWGLARLLDLSLVTQMTLTTKSVTSAIGMEVANVVGGLAPLSALMILVTGVLGGVIGPLLLNMAKIREPEARGMAYGLCAHAVGTQRAFEESTETGALAALSMSLMGVACAIILPLMLGSS